MVCRSCNLNMLCHEQEDGGHFMEFGLFFFPVGNGLCADEFLFAADIGRNTKTGSGPAGFENGFYELVVPVRCFNEDLGGVLFG